ncbi:MAG: hypothetical protein QM739_00050 [Propionivibrio sp.]
MRLLLLAASAALAASAFAQPADSSETNSWRSSWDGTLYGYASATRLQPDSVLNPDNQLARLADRSATTELRLNLKTENESLRLTARPILLAQTAHVPHDGAANEDDAYLSQWQVRLRATETWNVALGRDVLNWGPAQFRSPSSPYYFDNGRSDPMRELSGMDSVKVSWTPDRQGTLTLAYVAASGHDTPEDDPWQNSWLIKLDRRGDEWAYGLIAADAPDRSAFYGAFGQFTLSDAVMLYGEIGSSSVAPDLESPADPARPFAARKNSPRETAALIGASYTFEDGTSLAGELLHDGHGYSFDGGRRILHARRNLPGKRRSRPRAAAAPVGPRLPTCGLAKQRDG